MMKNTAIKVLKVLCGIVAVLALGAGIASMRVDAASHGIYIATATAHYRHPSTGVIEDSGGDGSAVLGQSMTESATNKSALVEVDANGNTWITIRLNLMDNIQSPKFQVDGSAVSASLMQEDYGNNTADYRMKVKSENSIIRCNMYVVPMGREVIFYITVGNLQSGSGDFITSITVKQPEPEPAPAPAPAPEPEPALTPSTGQTADSTSNSAQNQTAQQTNKPETPVVDTSSQGGDSQNSSQDVSENPDSEEVSAEGSDTAEAEGLAEFDASGDEVSKKTTETSKESRDSGNPILGWIIGGIVAIAAVGGGVWYFCFVRKGIHPFQKK